jgi:hypothetical protein
MIQLAHDEDLFSKLLETFRRVNEPKVKTLNGILDSSGLVGHKAYKARDTRTQDRSVVNTIINFFDGFSERNFNVNHVPLQFAFLSPSFDHGVQAQHAT